MEILRVIDINARGGVEVVEYHVTAQSQAIRVAGLDRQLEMLIPGTSYCMSIDDEADTRLRDMNVIATNFHNTHIEPDGDYPIMYDALICKVSNPDADPYEFLPENLTDEDIATIYDMIENSKDSMWRVKKVYHLDEIGMRIHEKRLKENKS